LRNSISTGSSTSSSEGSPVERLGAAMEAMAVDRDRGRDPATTPIQLCVAPDSQWVELMQPGEAVVFHSSIEVRSRTRRLTATLLPIPIPMPQSRPKYRHLVLTTHRLVCVKVKTGRTIEIKTEALLRAPPPREKEDKKDARPVIVDVVAKGQKSFVVLTSGKSQIFGTQEAPLTDRWIMEIKAAMALQVAGSSKGSRATSPGIREWT